MHYCCDMNSRQGILCFHQLLELGADAEATCGAGHQEGQALLDAYLPWLPPLLPPPRWPPPLLPAPRKPPPRLPPSCLPPLRLPPPRWPLAITPLLPCMYLSAGRSISWPPPLLLMPLSSLSHCPPSSHSSYLCSLPMPHSQHAASNAFLLLFSSETAPHRLARRAHPYDAPLAAGKRLHGCLR